VPSNGDNGTKPPGDRPRLTLVSPVPAVVTVPAANANADSGPVPGPQGDRLSLPSTPEQLRSLQELIDGHLSQTPYDHILHALSAVSNPSELSGYDVTFEFRNTRYRIYQEKIGHSVELTVSQTRDGVPRELGRITYLPDGQVMSSKTTTPHASPTGFEATHTQVLKNILAERAQRIVYGQDLYVRLRTSLEALRGRFTPETHSAWYDNFVVHRGKVYTFRIRNLFDGLDPASPHRLSPGSPGAPNPQLQQISIYEESGGDRTKILTLSASGEINFEPNRPGRDPLAAPQIEFLKQIIQPLESARVNPGAYQKRLEATLGRLEGGREWKAPVIAHSIEIPGQLGSGQGVRGEPILQIRRGLDLLFNFHPWASHRWQNPENPSDVRNLSPRGRMSFVLGRELLRWIGGTSKYFAFGDLRSPQPTGDWLRLHLFPEGGGQITLYRDGDIHDIILGEAHGPLWKASEEIHRISKTGVSFPSRLEALRAAVSQRDAKGVPTGLKVNAAPQIDLSQLQLGENGSPDPILNAETAWRRIQKQIPEGLEPRVRSSSRGNLLSQLLPVPPTDIDLIHVDFRESQPQLHLEISHHDIPSGEGNPLRRVEIRMKRGEDTHARVYEDGKLRLDIGRDIHRRLLNRAQEGTIPRNRITLLAQALPRIYGYYKTSGATYALSYFAALPVTLGMEHLMLTPAQRRFIGTPVPRFNLNYFVHDFSLPFMSMSTASGVAGVMIDGVYNMRPGLLNTLRMWRSGASLAQAYRLSRASFFNPSPNVRIIGRNFWFRGFLQRAVPLFAGLVALEYLHHGSMDRQRFLTTALNVGGVSLASAGLLRAVYSSETLANAGLRMGLIESSGVGAGASRYALRFWGGVGLATAELVLLSYLSARDRRSAMVQVETSMRDRVGQALSRRNEYITRLEHGEEISPEALHAADQELIQAERVYRHFLGMDERPNGTGQYAALGLDNDYLDEFDSYERQRFFLDTRPLDADRGVALSRLEMTHAQALGELHRREETLDRELNELYTRYGVPPEPREAGSSLRDFLLHSSATQAGSSVNALTEAVDSVENLPGAVRSPVALDSPEGEAILAHLRWKAGMDPSFTLISSERQADYLLRQFRGYRVEAADGSLRRWNREEALAFLSLAHRADAERVARWESPLTLPSSEEGYNTSNLTRLQDAEQEIRDRERARHTHAHSLGTSLAGNVADFDRQMEAYYRMSNERMGLALNRFLEGEGSGMEHLAEPMEAQEAPLLAMAN